MFKNSAQAASGFNAIVGHIREVYEECPTPLRGSFLQSLMRASSRFSCDYYEEFEAQAKKNISKETLTDVTVCDKYTSMKSPLANLRARLNRATNQRGMKSKLAKFMGVPLANVSQWLSGDREPGGETTLRLLHWVQKQEGK